VSSLNKAIIPLLVHKHSPVILDIGCYDGTDGLALHELAGGELHCFDPVSYEVFKGHGKPNVFFYPCAIGNEDSYIYFYPSPHMQSGSIQPPHLHTEIWPHIEFKERIKVRSFRLDTFWPEDKPIDFIWADINGAEGKFAQGAQKTLKRTKYMYIEYSNKELYHGQRNKAELLDMLETWTVLASYPGEDFGNLLLENEALW
jgi:FkbM family methyltransferase